MKPTSARTKAVKSTAAKRAAPKVSKGAKGVAGAKAFSGYVRSSNLNSAKSARTPKPKAKPSQPLAGKGKMPQTATKSYRKVAAPKGTGVVTNPKDPRSAGYKATPTKAAPRKKSTVETVITNWFNPKNPLRPK